MAYGPYGWKVMKITIIAEGKTEKAFEPHLRKYIEEHLPPGVAKPRIEVHPYNGRIPTGEKLRRVVDNLLNDRKKPSDYVIALTDVYTGSRPPEFVDAEDAKCKMLRWVNNEKRFFPHASQHDFEAWLLPYWSTIQKIAGSNMNRPSGNPEDVDHDKPPAYHLKAVFERGSCKSSYNKQRDGNRILSENYLDAAIAECPELKSLAERIISLCR